MAVVAHSGLELASLADFFFLDSWGDFVEAILTRTPGQSRGFNDGLSIDKQDFEPSAVMAQTPEPLAAWDHQAGNIAALSCLGNMGE